ncbi:recombination endonuclease, partial [Escherichia coli EC1868]
PHRAGSSRRNRIEP